MKETGNEFIMPGSEDQGIGIILLKLELTYKSFD